MISRKHAAIALFVAPPALVAAFVLLCGLASSSCFLWNQEPVCPPSKPYCLNDDDPVIWKNVHGAPHDASVGPASPGNTPPSDTKKD